MRRLTPLVVLCAVGVCAVGGGCHFSADRAISPGELRGTVVFQTAGSKTTAAAGAHIILENSATAIQADPQGSFILSGLPPGSYTITITASEAGTGVADSGLRLQNIALGNVNSPNGLGDGLDLGQIIIGKFGSIGGNVQLNSQNEPGVTVTLAGIAAAVTDANGAFEFTSVVPGAYSLTAFAPAASGSMAGPTITAPVAIQLNPLQQLTVATIHLEQGTQVTSGSLQGLVQLTGGGGNNMGIQMSLTAASTVSAPTPPFATSDATGDYEQTEVAAGVYTVTASQGGFESVSVPFIVIGVGTASVPPITLTPFVTEDSTGATVTDADRVAAACTNLAGCGALDAFSSLASCESTVGTVLTALEDNTPCDPSADALQELIDCLATSACPALQVSQADACPVPTQDFLQALSAGGPACQADASSLTGQPGQPDGGPTGDGGTPDGGLLDAGPTDAGNEDAGPMDAGPCGLLGSLCCPENGCGNGLECSGTTCIAGDTNYTLWPIPSDLPPEAAYGVPGDGTVVTDTVTGLHWQRQLIAEPCPSDGTGTCSWADAQSYCSSLDALAPGDIATGWRLPSIVELTTLVNYGDGIPAIDTADFPSTLATAFWSNTPNAADTTQSWTMSFDSGLSLPQATTGDFAVRCVSSDAPSGAVHGCGSVTDACCYAASCGPALTCNSSASCEVDTNYTQTPVPGDAPPESNYTVAADGATSTDTVTGLVWERRVSSSPCPADGTGVCTWSDAAAFCATLNTGALGGYTAGWRLPSVVELISTINYEMGSTGAEQAVDPVPFPNAPIASLWSSTASGVTSAWAVTMGTGLSLVQPVSTGLAVRCVNAPPAGTVAVSESCGFLGDPCCLANSCGPTLLCNAGTCATDENYSLWPTPPDAPVAGQYTLSTDQLVAKDTTTGLSWIRAQATNPCPSDGANCTWADAIAFCGTLNSTAPGGLSTGWRLPAVVELNSIVFYSTGAGPTIDSTAFTGTVAAQYWTATPAANNAAQAWAIDFSSGVSGSTSTTTLLSPRCVNSN